MNGIVKARNARPCRDLVAFALENCLQTCQRFSRP